MKTKRKKVLCPMERQGKTYWMRIGSAFTNVDGSTNVYLDAFPANGKLQIRDITERDEKRSTGSESSNAQSTSTPQSTSLPF